MKSDYVPSLLEDADIRSVIRLLGKVAIIECDLAEKKRLLLGGMCELIDGDGWAWSLTGPSDATSEATCLHSLSGGTTGALPALPAPASSAKLPVDRAKQGELSTGNRGMTIAARQLSENKLSQLQFGRLPGRAPFSLREEMMARIFCEEVAWLHDPPRLRQVAKFKLTPRQMATLALLAEGLSRKEIAVRLQLSPNTVQGYVKEIYRYFGTHSHAELLKRIPLPEK